MTESDRELLAVVIGHQIRKVRVERDMSQGELATGIGSQSMISLFESGRQLPYPEVLCLIADRLHDESLQEYARQLAKDELTWDSVSIANEDVLLDILQTHRGRWHDVHHRLAIRLCEYFYMRKETKVVQQICQLLVEHTETGHPSYARACFYNGSTGLLDADSKRAEHWLRRAEEYADTLDDTLLGRLWYNLGYLYTTMDVQGIAAWHANRAVDQFYRLQDFPRYAKSLGLLGAIQGRMGRQEDARKTLELAYELSVKWNADYHDRARIEASLTVIYYLLNDLDAAIQMIDRAKKSAAEVGDAIAETIVHQVLCLVLRKLGLGEDARAALRKSLSSAYNTGNVPLIAYSELLSIGHQETKHEQLEAAIRAFNVTLETPSHIEHALAAESAACLYEQIGEQENVKKYQQAALSGYRRYVDRNSMFSHLIKLLPIGHHES
ncbi:helix-turn-helix domain-containing protein [Alicyclobacillus mengziensis]|uniref:Helix-turn-helix domain-containing protein n=1 Tax=Alicyclobacillus mengziensis TaxID=2931921 RepID=A0A9X7VXQ6_9BACL|nr:helix-turn-helix domain-containing protein [Alicyclobacillus mengziensis]QSO46515.1 helix-turn-helix domain-containing protein [Alicyclobacillus mengziensis]